MLSSSSDDIPWPKPNVGPDVAVGRPGTGVSAISCMYLCSHLLGAGGVLGLCLLQLTSADLIYLLEIIGVKGFEMLNVWMDKHQG